MNELDNKYSVLKNYKPGSGEWMKLTQEVIDDKEGERVKFNDILFNKLHIQGIDVLQHGGETIILNPDVIENCNIISEDWQKRMVESAPKEKDEGYMTVTIGGKRKRFKSPIKRKR